MPLQPFLWPNIAPPFTVARIKIQGTHMRFSLQSRKNQHLDERIDVKGGKPTFAAFALALGQSRGSCRSYGGRTQKCCIRSKGGREPNVTDAAECRNVRFRGVDKIARKFRPTAAIHRVPSWRSATSQDKPFMHPTAFDDGHNALHQKPWRRSSSAISVLDAISRVGKAAK